MNELRKFYAQCMATAAGLALAVALAAPPLVQWLSVRYGAGSWVVWIASHATGRGAIVLALAGAEWFIRTRLWKWLRPQLDFSGMWKGWTTYTHVHCGHAEVPDRTGQQVLIEQDCLKLRLVPSTGLLFIFKSKAIEIDPEGSELVYAYHVQYNAGTKNRPAEAYGFESLQVIDTPLGKRPRKLRGWFAQCAHGQEPVFSGEVELFRQTGKQDEE